ncbi:MAG TPA: polysaccharide pyruvyl transferase CsaB [Chthonomonadaceae bacterium]|nr:polysaccharide pyruvyl transferase CsaB [Chthonomonadaceae bacterium]
MRFVVSGYYGCGNAGDEAVLAGIKESLARRAGEAADLTVLSQNPEETRRLHGLAAVDRMNLSAVRRALKGSDLLLSGGGSLLQDTTSVRSLLYYLWVIRLAYSAGVPTMFYAQGVGPLRRAVSRALVRLVANRAAYITVRDAPSAQLLAALGVSRPAIEVTADPAFALTPASARSIDALFEAENLPADAPLIGVALRPWGGGGESPVKSYARLLAELEAQCKARVVLLPMQTPGDVAFTEEVARNAEGTGTFPIVGRPYPPDMLLGLVGRMQAVVAMRLHALIFAARMGVPPFALSYDPKVENLMRNLGLADSLEHWRGFDPEEVAARVAAILADREARSASLCAQVPHLERLALRNAEIAFSLAERLYRFAITK